ncbi:MAG: nucleotidyltransferase family protein [Bacteroidota bacterium]|nr:nucleotidyltransferase family protein [Bacteroidota bacterium]MDP4233227.1 nucleotidyltransferase family protein [Bacteroidota bacterium]MDP4242154.1 nucleotidyltransferase family protein [Bacteroidota bacterium]MDP4287803.1 nucleotidyltransferase family protein [Bacteroidota bacterium]
MSVHASEVVILAGGASSRMGSAKALLAYAEGETFLDHIIASYRAAGVDRAIVVWSESASRDPRVLHAIAHPLTISLKTRHVFHENPSADRLESIRFGLRNWNGESSVFLQDVDRPFVNPSVIAALLSCEECTDFAAPDVFGHAGHPLLLSETVSHAVLEAPTTGMDFTLRDILRPFQRTLVRVGSMEEAFFLSININTPAEYREYFPVPESVNELVPA